MAKKDISQYNATWGICGFTSALTHLYDSDTRLKGKIDTSSSETIRRGLLIEVVTFLKYVKAFSADLINDLNKLNNALKSPSMGGGVIGFITLAEDAIRKNVHIGDTNTYQCALTPEALILYLQEMCGFTGAKLTTGSDPGGKGILGVVNNKGELLHWVYRAANGDVYNWGKVLPMDKWNKDADYGLGIKEFDHVGYHVSFG
ncbi:MAG: hypothetical protein ACYST6_00030 [Planctomycetota bacterium]